MHLHAVTGSFPPDTSAGAKSFFKLLYPLSREAGLKVEVTTVSLRKLAARDESLASYLNGFQLRRVDWRGQSLFEAGNRVLKLFTDDYYLFARACRKILQQERPADLYLLRGQYFSTFLLAPFIRHDLQRPVVLFYSDPWLQNEFLPWTSALRQRCAHLEQEALRCASGVIFTNAETERIVLSGHSTLPLRRAVFPHVYLAELYAPPSRCEARDSDDEIVFTYAGHFYGSRQPAKLFAALALLQRENPRLAQRVRLQIAGPSAADYKAAFRNYLAQLSALGLSSRVQFPGQIDYLSTLKLLQESDVLINIDASTDRSPYLPSKLIDYLGSKRPIWTISPPGPAADLVEKYGGIVTRVADVNSIKNDLLRCLTSLLEKNWILNLAFAAQFESWNVCPRLKNFLETVAEQDQHSLSHRPVASGRRRATVAGAGQAS